MSKLIYVENDYDGAYGKFWSNLGEVCRDRNEFLRHPHDFDLACFTGGADVSPNLYGHKNLGSHNDPARDEREIAVFRAAVEARVALTGICRGAQFLNSMAGGTMIQHIRRGHSGGTHLCETFDEQLFEVTSSHHQMIVPGPGGKVVAWAEHPLKREDVVYDGEILPGDNSVMDALEVIWVTEAIHYPDYPIFAVQHHPEWQNVDAEAAQWTLRMIRRFCFGEQEATA